MPKMKSEKGLCNFPHTSWEFLKAILMKNVHTGTESPTHAYEHFGDRQKLAMHIVRC